MQEESKGLMFTAYQKFFSALNCINQFRTENNSFINVSYLDSFFSEFRNITFVLQKCIPGGASNPFYKENRELYFSSETMKWFIYKRDQVIHKYPVSLLRLFQLEVYGPSSYLTKKTYFYDDEDHPKEDIQKALIRILSSINQEVEINFSVRHLIVDKHNLQDLDMMHLIRQGISTMWDFLKSMKIAFNDYSSSLLLIEEKITHLLEIVLNNEILFVTDYLYIVPEKKLIPASVGLVSFGVNNKKQRLSNLIRTFQDYTFNLEDNIELFKWFVFQNIPLFGIGLKDLMSTFFISFTDSTYVLKPFFSSVRATTYRLINEVASIVENGDVKAVVFMCEAYVYEVSDYDKIADINYEERKKQAKKEVVIFDLISEANILSLTIDPSKINKPGYFQDCLDGICTEITGPLLEPIRIAFQKVKETNNAS
jgi:hypothetical protein